jgi:hypothetical protein
MIMTKERAIIGVVVTVALTVIAVVSYAVGWSVVTLAQLILQ